MRKLMTAIALLALIGGSAAIAQNSGNNASPSAIENRTRMSAPVGHRQPRPSDVPAQSTGTGDRQVDAEDAALDRKIKSICRGC